MHAALSLSYPEALTRLGASRRFGMKLGLETMESLADALGRPQDRLRFVHLAGTNGKGSTAAFLESCLRAGGLKVGLFTSPHLVSVRERIQIDRQPISRADFSAGLAQIFGETARQKNALSPTFFELLTTLALLYFAARQVDWVVWETGLGGRLDSTNLVTPAAVVITNIGMDHQRYLGDTLEAIAAEKAGIIKPGVPVITATPPNAALRVISDRAHALGAPLILLPRDLPWADLGRSGFGQTARLGADTFALGLGGPHQIANAACALAALRQIAPLPVATLQRGLAATRWPGRLQILRAAPLLVLDGAHNCDGARALVVAWREMLVNHGGGCNPAPGAHLVFASVLDKDIGAIAQILRPVARRVSLVRLLNERSADPAELARHFPGLPLTLFASVAALWAALTTESEATLLAGSLFLAGEVLAQLEPEGADEVALNERLENLKPGG